MNREHVYLVFSKLCTTNTYTKISPQMLIYNSISFFPQTNFPPTIVYQLRSENYVEICYFTFGIVVILSAYDSYVRTYMNV